MRASCARACHFALVILDHDLELGKIDENVIADAHGFIPGRAGGGGISNPLDDRLGLVYHLLVCTGRIAGD